MTLYNAEVVRICSATLDASNIRHAPITSRIKSWEYAERTIAQQEERNLRRGLRDTVETQDRRWEDYLRESGLNLNGEEMEPFQTPKYMLAALHGFGGMRISPYFPRDIERAVSTIHTRFDVIRRIDKGHAAQGNSQGLKVRLQSLQKAWSLLVQFSPSIKIARSDSPRRRHHSNKS